MRVSEKSNFDRRGSGETEPVHADFERIFLDSYDALKAMISRYLRRPEDVEDIVQETFVKSFEAKRKSRIRNVRAYLFTTARNLSLKHKALHANKLTDYMQDLDVLGVIDREIPLDSVVEAHEQFGIFCEAVRDLPLQCRRVFILKKVYGLSHKEIAQRLNITVGTATQHLAKGVSRCTLYMEERGYLRGTGGKGVTASDGQ